MHPVSVAGMLHMAVRIDPGSIAVHNFTAPVTVRVAHACLKAGATALVTTHHSKSCHLGPVLQGLVHLGARWGGGGGSSVTLMLLPLI